jgi:hypothetical protein
MDRRRIVRKPTDEESSNQTGRRNAPTKIRRKLMVAVGMLAALFGGHCMGSAAIVLASGAGEVRGLAKLFLAEALTVVVARRVYRYGGMVALSVYAAVTGLAVILGPALMM